MAFWGFRQKMVTPTPTSPQILKILHYKSRFSLKTRRKCHQNSYSNRKQPMGISNSGLKIWPEVEIWPFLRMRSRKLTTWNRGPISKIFQHIGNRARRSQIWGRILHRT